MRKIFELMPFDNQVVVINVDGTVVNQLFNRIIEYGGWPISKQVRLTALDGQLQEATINGKAVQAHKKYKIALSDFIANGGDKCYFLKDQPQENLGIMLRDMMIEYVREETAKGNKLDAKRSGRIMIPGEQ